MTEMRAETGDIQDRSVHDFEDVFLYVLEEGQIIHISEGDGTNLLDEDIEEGYVDYIDYSQYDLSGGIQEADGGMMLSEESVRERYAQLADCIGDVLEMAYGRRDMTFIRLEGGSSKWDRK